MTRAAPRNTRRAPWSDLRFLLGVLLIGASIAGVWAVVTASRQTSPVYAAAHTIAAGATVTAADFDIVEVSLGAAADLYVPAGPLDDGAVALRTIDEGEVVPHSAVGDAAALQTTNVVVRTAGGIPASVERGTAVEVWETPLLERREQDAPRILVAEATVVAVTKSDSVMGGTGVSLEIAIPRSEVAGVLAAVSAEAPISVVPVIGSAP